MATTTSDEDFGNAGYEIFIAALSVLSIVNIFLVHVIQDDAMDQIVYLLDGLLSLVFLTDFLVRLHRAPSRSGYFLRQFGWADLLASLPFPQAKALRVFRLFRVGRVMRRYGVGTITRRLVRDRAGSALFTLLLIGVLVLEFGSLAMLHLEQDVDGANITTASDAVWYVLVTISTVGYGDQFPVSNPGREMGALIIVVGVGIFGTLTGYLANLFLSPSKPRPAEEATASPDEAAERLEQLKALLAQQQAAVAELESLVRGPNQSG